MNQEHAGVTVMPKHHERAHGKHGPAHVMWINHFALLPGTKQSRTLVDVNILRFDPAQKGIEGREKSLAAGLAMEHFPSHLKQALALPLPILRLFRLNSFVMQLDLNNGNILLKLFEPCADQRTFGNHGSKLGRQSNARHRLTLPNRVVYSTS